MSLSPCQNERQKEAETFTETKKFEIRRNPKHVCGQQSFVPHKAEQFESYTWAAGLYSPERGHTEVAAHDNLSHAKPHWHSCTGPGSCSQNRFVQCRHTPRATINRLKQPGCISDSTGVCLSP